MDSTPVTYVAFVRGINVGGHKQLAMEDLVAMLHELGYPHARSYLRTGNLIFGASGISPRDLEVILERETARKCGIRAEYIVRTQEQITALVIENPFPDEAVTDPSHLVVQFTKAVPHVDQVEALKLAVKGRETVGARVGQDLYIYYLDGIGNSKLTGAIIDRNLGTVTTGRNWNTVVKLQELAAEHMLTR